jgi:hypothetical protein
VEPVEQVLGARVEVEREVTDVFAAVGEKRDLLIGVPVRVVSLAANGSRV